MFTRLLLIFCLVFLIKINISFIFQIPEAEHKVHLEYPVGILGPSKVTVKKTPDGWQKYNIRSDSWESLRTDIGNSNKKAVHRPGPVGRLRPKGQLQQGLDSMAQVSDGTR